MAGSSLDTENNNNNKIFNKKKLIYLNIFLCGVVSHFSGLQPTFFLCTYKSLYIFAFELYMMTVVEEEGVKMWKKATTYF